MEPDGVKRKYEDTELDPDQMMDRIWSLLIRIKGGATLANGGLSEYEQAFALSNEVFFGDIIRAMHRLDAALESDYGATPSAVSMAKGAGAGVDTGLEEDILARKDIAEARQQKLKDERSKKKQWLQAQTEAS